MTNKDKAIQLLGLAYRAQKLETGEGPVLQAIRNRKAKLVMLATDASNNTKKQFYNKCEYYDVPLVEPIDRYALGHAIGKDFRVVIAVLDDGFAKQMRANLGQ